MIRNFNLLFGTGQNMFSFWLKLNGVDGLYIGMFNPTHPPIKPNIKQIHSPLLPDRHQQPRTI